MLSFEAVFKYVWGRMYKIPTKRTWIKLPLRKKIYQLHRCIFRGNLCWMVSQQKPRLPQLSVYVQYESLSIFTNTFPRELPRSWDNTFQLPREKISGKNETIPSCTTKKIWTAAPFWENKSETSFPLQSCQSCLYYWIETEQVNQFYPWISAWRSHVYWKQKGMINRFKF